MSHILVIEDAEHLRSVLELTLEFKGYSVAMASNGQEGLEATAAAQPDLILCDIEMPVMNGLEFVRRFREKCGPATPVIMLTAEGSDLVRAAMAAGATAYIAKPFEPIALLKEIEEYLQA